MPESLRGHLIVATPELGDPNFFQTVVLLLEHTEEGALGLVLNRASDTRVEEHFPLLSQVAAAPGVFFVGGPVADGALICLARVNDTDTDGWEGLDGNLGILDLGRHLHDPPGTVEQVRIFSGYAGWGGGQLEAEMASGGWFVLDSEPHDPLTSDPSALWREVLRRQRGKLGIFANYPEDLSTN
ncbi:MAG: hypothetical protein JJLCMIEE_00252 [Acidimicrobiales bacterium]|nr:MAG: hypothetical protein EDR02_01530 [Actinomycetota bacterium]MBV6507211.1 hypothetical protein [Acidimicrobiales bacterium]RIK05503.1 MAG: hypothetical protein DCC48_09400 [Acidobacteriota bacterium]